jgi:hypothetical protein
MGYAGKWVERERARELRAQSWTLLDIATEVGVSKSSVSLWVRDVPFDLRPRNRGHSSHKPHPLTVKKQAEIERCRVEAAEFVGEMSERDLTMFCLGLYAGEGGKTQGAVSFANTNPIYLAAFACWLRRTFEVDLARVRVKLYLHEGLDLEAATGHWSRLLDVPQAQFGKAYRAVADPTRRTAKHVNGCATLVYSCTTTHRRVMAMVAAVASPFANPG